MGTAGREAASSPGIIVLSTSSTLCTTQAGVKIEFLRSVYTGAVVPVCTIVYHFETIKFPSWYLRDSVAVVLSAARGLGLKPVEVRADAGRRRKRKTYERVLF